MSFTLTVHGSAGAGMDSNGPDEIAAVQAVMQAIEHRFEQVNLSLGSVEVSPPQWAKGYVEPEKKAKS